MSTNAMPPPSMPGKSSYDNTRLHPLFVSFGKERYTISPLPDNRQSYVCSREVYVLPHPLHGSRLDNGQARLELPRRPLSAVQLTRDRSWKIGLAFARTSDVPGAFISYARLPRSAAAAAGTPPHLASGASSSWVSPAPSRGWSASWSCMSEVHRVRLSRKSCMIRVLSL